MQFLDLYSKIVNKPLTIRFKQYFDIVFYVLKNQDQSIKIYDKHQKNTDKIQLKCRKLSLDNWNILNYQQNVDNRQKLLIVFSIVQTNFLTIQFDQNGFITVQSLNKFLSLNVNIIRYIVKKINEFYRDDRSPKYRSDIASEFKKLYNSTRAITLKHRQIGQYLQYCSFWQKLGLNYFQIRQLPYDFYKQCIMMMNVQTEVKNAEMKKMNDKIRNSR